MKVTWRNLDERRTQFPSLSRAELARRAGISESTFTKGIAGDRSPHKDTRKKVELVLEAERHMAQAGLR